MDSKSFDERYAADRRGTSCLKFDFGMQRKGRTDLLPLWVADMDFKLPDEILSDFHRRIDHGIFGYTDPDAEYYAALDRWFFLHHGYHVEAKNVTTGCGIVYALAVSVRAFTNAGDAILIQQPVYYPFRKVIEDNGRRMVNNQLHYESGKYTIDFKDLEQKIVAHDVKAVIFCSPHNPVGRVWSRQELEQLGDICLRHKVILMADEIHCDFTYPGHEFTSFMTLDAKYRANLAVYTSPSKTFNVAGFQPANVIIENKALRAGYRSANAAAGYSQGNIMAQIAVKSVYTKGDKWARELMEYITGNMEYMRAFIKENLPKAHFVEPEGTYLAWVDFSEYGFTDEELEGIILNEAKLWLDSGKVFGPATAQFERFNIACPRVTLEQAMRQLKAALSKYGK